MLRRQVRRDFRKPLVVMTPKQPLRMKESRSSVTELTSGCFQEILDDPTVGNRESVTRIVLCTGKVAWDVMAERNNRNAPVAVIRIEQLYPFPIAELHEILARYPNAKQVVWVQEEPENMGAWHFVDDIVWGIKNKGFDWRHVSRFESGSPATGSKTIHDQELASLLEETFADWQ